MANRVAPILITSLVLLVAGCSSVYDGLDARFHSNHLGESLVQFQLLRGSDSGFEMLANSSFSLAPGETKELTRLTSEAGNYRVVVRVHGNESSREFNFRKDTGPGWVEVVLEPNRTRIDLGYT